MSGIDDKGSFSVTMPLCKVWEDEEGEMRFEGVASSTTLDRQQERMTARAIRKMAQYKGLELLPSHDASPIEELGIVEEAWADNDQFRIAGKLDKHNPAARRLFEKVMQGRRFGLSVGGRVTKAFWRYDEEAGRHIRHIDDVELDHVAVCRPDQAANPDTYLAALAKAANGVIDEDAVLSRIGRAAVQAARNLWPFAKTEEIAVDETANSDQDTADLHELRKEVEQTLAELREALTTLKKSRANPEETDAKPARGTSKALPGQEEPRRRSMWHEVV